MGEIRLTGLKSGVPIGFMAALGTFRHVMEMPELGEVKLFWTPYAAQWCAALSIDGEVSEDSLARSLAERVKSMAERPELQWSNAVKDASREKYVHAASKALEHITPEDHGLADWFAAFGNELVNSESGTIESTPFDMTVARQQFLADAAWLHKELGTADKKKGDQRNIASFHEALFEEWKYADDQHSLGWDPGTILLGAFTSKAPTAMRKAGVRALVWLAMESLPLMPCVFDRGLATRGFRRQGRKQFLRWPVWETPLSLACIGTLLSQVIGMDAGERRTRGIAGAYESQIYKPNKYLTSFQQPTLL